jgi:hypothetical protein
MTGNKNQLTNAMTTKQQACFANFRTPLEQSISSLDESRKMDLETGNDDLQGPGQPWFICLEALLWLSAVAGWGAIAYLYHMHPSFG